MAAQKVMVGQCSQSDLKAVNVMIGKAWEQPENKGKKLLFEDFKPQMTKGQVVAWKVICWLAEHKASDCVPYLKEVLMWSHGPERMSFVYKPFKHAPEVVVRKLQEICLK